MFSRRCKNDSKKVCLILALLNAFDEQELSVIFH